MDKQANKIKIKKGEQKGKERVGNGAAKIASQSNHISHEYEEQIFRAAATNAVKDGAWKIEIE